MLRVVVALAALATAGAFAPTSSPLRKWAAAQPRTRPEDETPPRAAVGPLRGWKAPRSRRGVLKSSSLNSAASATVEASSAATGPKVYRDVRALSATADLDPLPLPAHPGLKVGRLSNGLTYVLLRNAAPAGRFEAHLEILAGSADETDAQQGMAHLVEHIAYMGSRKREALFGEAAETRPTRSAWREKQKKQKKAKKRKMRRTGVVGWPHRKA